MLGEFNGKLGTDDIFKTTIRNERLRQDRNDICFRIVNMATQKYLIVKSIMFLHRNIYKYTWTSHDVNTHNQIDHILMERRWYSYKFDVRSSRGTDYDAIWCLQKLGKEWQQVNKH